MAKNLSCSFCGKPQSEVKKLIAGPSVSICDECVGLAGDIVQEEDDRQRALDQDPTAGPHRIWKYHGLGNDFLVLEFRVYGHDIDPETAIALCDRHRGLGADGVLVLTPSETATARMVVHNSDGSIPEMCGNGLRCAVKHLADSAGDLPPSITVETGAGILDCAIHYDLNGEAAEIEISLGPARLADANLPSNAPFVDAPVPGHEGLRGTAISLGNPHLVLSNGQLEDATTLGPVLERHPDFKDRTNVEFVLQEGPGLKVHVWERGAGFTQACGTGAAASVAAFVHRGLLPSDTWVPVQLPGGTLQVKVSKDLSACVLKGPAAFVYETRIPLPFVTR